MNIAHYKRFCQQLDLDKFNGNVDEACLFYFKLLQELGLQVANIQAQVDNLKTIIGSQPKTSNNNSKSQFIEIAGEQPQPKGQMKKPYHQRLGSQSKEQEVLEFNCDYKGCQEMFTKNSRLAHHKMLKHRDPPVDFTKNRVFRVQIRDISGEGRRPSRF